jgi:hypothetical protein
MKLDQFIQPDWLVRQPNLKSYLVVLLDLFNGECHHGLDDRI